MRSLHDLEFDNSDARLGNLFHARVCPTAPPTPYGVSFTVAVVALIDLDRTEATSEEWVQVFSRIPSPCCTRATSSASTFRNLKIGERSDPRATEHQDFGEIDRLLALLRTPFDEQPEREDYAAPPPDWGNRLVVSCSS